MKNTSLLFRSLAIIIFLAGSAHLIRLGSSYTANESVYETGNSSNNRTGSTIDEEHIESFPQNDSNSKKANHHNKNTDYIIGKWSVNYETDEFNGAIIYDLKKENNVFNAYTIAYQDKNGNSEKAEGNKVLTIKKFDGHTGSGVYKIEYEGQEYKVDCTIDIIDENTFKLSYDYYGYSDMETWKRQ